MQHASSSTKSTWMVIVTIRVFIRTTQVRYVRRPHHWCLTIGIRHIQFYIASPDHIAIVLNLPGILGKCETRSGAARRWGACCLLNGVCIISGAFWMPSIRAKMTSSSFNAVRSPYTFVKFMDYRRYCFIYIRVWAFRSVFILVSSWKDFNVSGTHFQSVAINYHLFRREFPAPPDLYGNDDDSFIVKSLSGIQPYCIWYTFHYRLNETYVWREYWSAPANRYIVCW